MTEGDRNSKRIRSSASPPTVEGQQHAPAAAAAAAAKSGGVKKKPPLSPYFKGSEQERLEKLVEFVVGKCTGLQARLLEMEMEVGWMGG